MKQIFLYLLWVFISTESESGQVTDMK